MMAVAAGAAAAGAVWLGGAPWALAATRLGPSKPRQISRWFLGLTAVGMWFVVAQNFGAPRAILSVAVVLVLGAGWIRIQHTNARKLQCAGRVACVEIAETLAADLRAGALPRVSIERLALEFDVLVEVHRGMCHGADMAEAWKRAAKQPGCDAFVWVGAAWAVANESGAPLAEVLDSVAAEVRSELELVRDVEAAVAPARSTALLMAVLPLFALGLGSGMGAAPVEVITTNIWGAVSVTLGVTLAVAGVFWVDLIAEGVERQ